MHLIKSILFFLLCSLSVFANTTPLATKITDLAGKSVTYNYNTDDDLSSVTDQMGSSENSFLFTGEQFDKESDNYYLRARYYSPSSTRFMSRDTYDGTAGNPITQNHYLYGNANPVMFVDPSGKFSVLSTSFSISTIAELCTISNSVGFLFGGNKAVQRQQRWNISFTGAIGVVNYFFTPNRDKCIKLIDKMPYLTLDDKQYFKDSTDAIMYSAGVSMFMGPAQGGVATMAQELGYLLIAKYAAMQNEINFITGRM